MTAALYARFTRAATVTSPAGCCSALRNQFGGHSVRTRAEQASDPADV